MRTKEQQLYEYFYFKDAILKSFSVEFEIGNKLKKIELSLNPMSRSGKEILVIVNFIDVFSFDYSFKEDQSSVIFKEAVVSMVEQRIEMAFYPLHRRSLNVLGFRGFSMEELIRLGNNNVDARNKGHRVPVMKIIANNFEIKEFEIPFGTTFKKK